MIALFGDLAFTEILLIAGLAVIVFGRDLPRVAAQAYSRFQKARRALMSVWRDSGIGEEIRQMQREIDRGADEIKRHSPRELARNSLRDVEAQVKSPFESSQDPLAGIDSEHADPDPRKADDTAPAAPPEVERGPDPEPAGEAQRRPPWYPEMHDPIGEAPAQSENEQD